MIYEMMRKPQHMPMKDRIEVNTNRHAASIDDVTFAAGGFEAGKVPGARATTTVNDERVGRGAARYGSRPTGEVDITISRDNLISGMVGASLVQPLT